MREIEVALVICYAPPYSEVKDVTAQSRGGLAPQWHVANALHCTYHCRDSGQDATRAAESAAACKGRVAHV